MWHNKRLRSVVVGSEQSWELSPPEQAVSSPAWSPDGQAIAFVAMPDSEGISGGNDAMSALMQRELWIIEANREPRRIQVAGWRIEAPQWIDNDMVLVAVYPFNQQVTLMKVDISRGISQSVTQEITPAPDWFGFYGHIDWSDYFSVWRPPTAAPMMAAEALPPTVAPRQLDPPASGKERALLDFLEVLHPQLTSDEAIHAFGEPDNITGSGLLIYQYHLSDGVWLWLAFPGAGPLSYAQLRTPSGKIFPLGFLPPEEPATPTPSIDTPTPSSMDAAPNEAPLTPTPEWTATMVPREAMTATPIPALTSTPTPAAETLSTLPPTAPMPEPTATPIPLTPTPTVEPTPTRLG
jgi:hypothetical protein